MVNAYDYDSYGNIEASVESIANPYTYTGRELDAESGLYHYRARYYDPATGKFLADDPLGFAAGDFNLSRYVFNNPVNLTDPSGEIIPQLIGGCILGSAFDAGLQLIGNGGRLGCLNLGEVAGACVVGSIGAALGPVAGRLVAQQFGRVAKAVRGAGAAGRRGAGRTASKPDFIVTPGGIAVPSQTPAGLKVTAEAARRLGESRFKGELALDAVDAVVSTGARFVEKGTGNLLRKLLGREVGLNSNSFVNVLLDPSGKRIITIFKSSKKLQPKFVPE